MDFEINLNEDNNMYVYNTLRAWADLIYDPLNGRQGLKKDYVGEIYVGVFNKAGQIYREFRFKPAYLEAPINAMDLSYADNEIYRIAGLKFRCDSYVETRVGQIEV